MSSSSSASLAPLSAPPESFREASVSHGAAGGSSHFHGDDEISKEENPKLNPLAEEFVPFPLPSSSELVAAMGDTTGQNILQPSSGKKIDFGTPSRRKGRHESHRSESVMAPSTVHGSKAGHGQSSSSSVLTPPGRNGSSKSWQSSGSSPGNIPQGGRKDKAFKANHLLKFQYDPIPRPPPRSQPPRRQKRAQPYNKELFLQANFRFLVSDLGDYVLNASDPDKMLQWEDVAAVNMMAPVPVQCPICLDTPPLCPQITSCGHIFCFPCILHYLMLGDQRGDPWKKCPLCFAMISCKELRTVSITSVQQCRPGDRLKFNLLTRAKTSITPFEKSKGSLGALAYSDEGQFHLYSKFTLTSDAEVITNRGVADLTTWATRAEVEGGEDLDIVPFVYEAIDQLQQRKQIWMEHRTLDFMLSSPPVQQRIVSQPKAGFTKAPGDSSIQLVKGADVDGVVKKESVSINANMDKEGLKKRHQGVDDGVDIVAETEAAMARLKEKAGWVYEGAFSDDEDEGNGLNPNIESKAKGLDAHLAKPPLDQDEIVNIDKEGGIGESSEDDLVGSPEANDPFVVAPDRNQHDTKRDQEESDFYTFYQSADGQFLILHPLNMKCLLQYYGDYESLPSSIEADVVELEAVAQTEATRKRYRYLSHLPLTANFQLCEVDLSEMVPSEAFTPFLEEIRTRQQRRRRRLQLEKSEKAKEERLAAAAMASRPKAPSPADYAAYLVSLQTEEVFQTDDVVVGESPLVVASSPSERRVLFSNVAKMGFASGYDAPQLPPVEAVSSSPWGASATSSRGMSSATSAESGGQGSSSSLSFADIIQAQARGKAEPEEGVVPAVKSGRKNKKGSLVLLSTAGGRRY